MNKLNKLKKEQEKEIKQSLRNYTQTENGLKIIGEPKRDTIWPEFKKGCMNITRVQRDKIISYLKDKGFSYAEIMKLCHWSISTLKRAVKKFRI